MIVGMVIAGFTVLTIVFVAALLLPRLRVAAERQRVAGEVRQGQWRLQQATTAAMARLLAEGRRGAGQ